MSFTSAAFLLLFFPAAILGNYYMKEKYRNVFLCLAALVFYAWCGIRFLLLMLMISGVDYGIGLVLGNKKAQRYKKVFLILGLIVNTGVLVYYKYLFNIMSAVSPWIAAMAGHEISFMTSAPALPLGISFYTFSLLSYLLDVYWGICPAQKDYLNIWLYVAFFPKVVQGPIVRYADFDKQLRERERDADARTRRDAAKASAA